ncbi:hypothetical protein ACHAXT_001756 [Thalassiosira profunda]
MADGDDSQGPGLVAGGFIVAVLLYFVVSAFAPLLDFMATSPTATDLSLGDAVVTRQDGESKLKTYQSKFDALSPARVQEKLSNLPVFFVSTDDGAGWSRMGERIYLSFGEAEGDAKASGGIVKATTLDQVLYPLILKKEGGKVSASTPVEIKAARESVSSSYRLVPSKAARNEAKDISLKEGDIPLFVVERLAFASDDGRPQVPLFTERGDAVTSYARLREAGGNKLPEEPTIRTTSLLDVLDSMERGTRPGVGQLQFYGNADDNASGREAEKARL